MRYSSALVLSTVAIGQVAAHTIRHASFHARRHADSKREVDYSKVDYSSVDWKKVDWAEVFRQKQKGGDAPSATPEVVEVKTEEAPKESSKAEEGQGYSAPAATSTKAEAPKETKSKTPLKDIGEKIGDKIEDFVEGLFDGIAEFCEEKGISGPGKNSQKPTGDIWLGHSDWSANFFNGGSEDVWVTCWKENSFTGMTINVNQPAILVKIPVGGNQTVSFAPKVASACAPLYKNTKLANFGGVHNPWFEANFGPSDGSFVGTFDVSKNTRMKGDSIDAVGSKCTSNMNTCVFECQDKSADSCTTGYELVNCQASNGGGGGYDSVMQGVGGGCAMGSQRENIQVTFSNTA